MDSNSGTSFSQDSTIEKLDELQIPFDDDDDPTSNIQLLTDNSESMVLERKVDLNYYFPLLVCRNSIQIFCFYFVELGGNRSKRTLWYQFCRSGNNYQRRRQFNSVDSEIVDAIKVQKQTKKI